MSLTCHDILQWRAGWGLQQAKKKQGVEALFFSFA
jgi:hypothetical protein